MAKIRTQEIIALVAFQDRYAHEVKTISEPQLLSSVHKMKSVETLDKAFNIEFGSVEIREEDQIFAKFQDELNQIAETQRLLGQAPVYPFTDNINQTETKKKVMMQTVATILTQQFSRLKLPMQQLDTFLKFAKTKSKASSQQLTGQLTYKQQDLDNAGKILFDYIEIEDNKTFVPDDLINWLGTLSSSLGQIYFHGQVEILKTHS